MAYERITDDHIFDGEVRNSHEMRYRIASAFAEKEDTILDAGCGTGYGMKFFDKEDQWYRGLDKKPIPDASKSFYFWDFEIPGILEDAEFDLFVGLEIIEHLNQPGVMNFVDMAHKANKWIVISTPIVPNSNPYHKQQFNEEEILSLFKNDEWEHYQTVYQKQGDRYGIFIFKRK